jgi:hypothetical protein
MTIEKRLENLESELAREKRFNRCLLAIIGSIIMACFIIWAFGPKIAEAQLNRSARDIIARRFVLIDDKGNLRAELSMFEGGPRLCLKDDKGNFRAILEANRGQSGLSLWDERGKFYSAYITVFEDEPMICLKNKFNKPIWKAP